MEVIYSTNKVYTYGISDNGDYLRAVCLARDLIYKEHAFTLRWFMDLCTRVGSPSPSSPTVKSVGPYDQLYLWICITIYVRYTNYHEYS